MDNINLNKLNKTVIQIIILIAFVISLGFLYEPFVIM